MQLYGSSTSPYVRKVRILLLEKNISCQFVIEGPGDPAGNVAAYNPLGKVPVLVRDNGESLFDSPVIMEYLDSLSAPALLPPLSEARWQVQRWRALAQGMMDATVSRLLEARRPVETRSQEAIAKQEQKVFAALRFATDKLGGNEFIVEDRYTLADIALGAALDYIDFRFTTEWHQEFPTLSRWVKNIAKREAFVVTAPVK